MATLKQMQKKFATLRKRQEALQAEMKRMKRGMEAQRTIDIGRIIKQTGFPVENMAILIGALLHAKEHIDEGDQTAIDNYSAAYARFSEAHPDAGFEDLVEPSAEEPEAQVSDGEEPIVEETDEHQL